MEVNNAEKSIDISSRRVVAMRDVQEAVAAGATRLVIAENCVVTPSARDFLQQRNVALEKNGNGSAALANPPAPANASASSAPTRAANPRLFSTPEAEAIKKEICAVGRKLWMRQFVDGNGGNISYRIGPNEVLCTLKSIKQCPRRSPASTAIRRMQPRTPSREKFLPISSFRSSKSSSERLQSRPTKLRGRPSLRRL